MIRLLFIIEVFLFYWRIVDFIRNLITIILIEIIFLKVYNNIVKYCFINLFLKGALYERLRNVKNWGDWMD